MDNEDVLFELVVTAPVAIVAASLRRGNRKITGSNNNSTGLPSQANKYVPPKSMAKESQILCRFLTMVLALV